jgi:thioredoxin 1
VLKLDSWDPTRIFSADRLLSTARDASKFRLLAKEVRVMAAPAVTDSSFKDDVLDSKIPVLVDFWAPWCGPCRLVGPVVDELAQQYEGKVKVVKLNTDDNPEVASQYAIRSIPTLMIFKGGRHVETVVGAVPKTTLCSTIEKHL